MAFKPVDAETPVNHARDMRETVIKSGLSGVAATVLAVTIWSPAGLGGMIGTSVASGADSNSAAADAVGRLARFPVPISEVELADIQAKLTDSQVSLQALRDTTEDEIANIRAIASGASFAAPMDLRGHLGPGLDVTDSLGVARAPVVAGAAPAAETADVAAAAVPVTVGYDAPAAPLGAAVVTYIGGNEYNSAPDPNMELASLLLAY